MVEHLFCKQDVVGSNPTGGSKIPFNDMLPQNTTDPKTINDDEIVDQPKSEEPNGWDDEFDNILGDLIIF